MSTLITARPKEAECSVRVRMLPTEGERRRGTNRVFANVNHPALEGLRRAIERKGVVNSGTEVERSCAMERLRRERRGAIIEEFGGVMAGNDVEAKRSAIYLVATELAKVTDNMARTISHSMIETLKMGLEGFGIMMAERLEKRTINKMRNEDREAFVHVLAKAGVGGIRRFELFTTPIARAISGLVGTVTIGMAYMSETGAFKALLNSKTIIDDADKLVKFLTFQAAMHTSLLVLGIFTLIGAAAVYESTFGTLVKRKYE
jgi:hypothetical protein